ncbi:hypothetical protein [Tsukamurella pseudospumae]|uniref:Minor tail protein n=1 Tax=Tsukamurella pseudospumae TaxID=239498 RepID=A0A137ZRT7_9ACTN|nr:hypothetical protein [Tsukamurella pseudospumae]KXP00913.1 hypothetical protein AXK61_12960 [Tsukamurella pseudospumae]
MTSPDGAAPPGTFPAQLLNTLQDIQACGVGKEGKLLIQALAAFGDGITREFYHGFTNVVDAVQAGFDALGEALSGEPGMGGILGFASDIQGTLLGAIELSEVLLGDVTEILKQLALGLGCNDVTGPIAENIGQALRDALNKLTAVMRMLFTLIEVIVGIPGATMEDLAAFLSGKWDAIGAVSALAGRIRDMILEAFGFTPTGDDAADLLGALTSIPQQAVAGLQGALSSINTYIQDLVNAILRAIRGIPVVGGTLADIIAEIGGLQQKAVDAESSATAAHSTAAAVASSALTTTVVNPNETITRTVYGPGTTTWNRPTASSGKKITKFGIHVIGAGQGGGKAEKGNGQGAADGIDGGAYYLEVLPADMPASLSVVVANGGAGATSTGPGAMPSATRVMNGASVFAEATMGAAFAKLAGAVPVRLETKPGRGGRGGDALLKDVSTDSNGAVTGKSYSRGDGEDGESCAGGVGGAGGRSSGGWLGGSTTNAAAGPAARTDPVYRFGAPGGGGGYAGANSATTSGAGAAGGNPGGGGGGGGGSPYTGFGGGTGNGGAGGPGEITFYVFEEPL